MDFAREASACKRMRIRPCVIIGLTIPITLGVLFLLVYLAGDIHNLPAVMSHTRWWLFLPVPLTVPVFYMLHSLRFSLALKSIGAAPSSMTGLATCILSGNLANVLVPGMGGELVTAYLASRFYCVPMPYALASSVFTKVVGLATNVTISLVGIALIPGSTPGATMFDIKLLLEAGLFLLLAAIVGSLVFPTLVNLLARVIRRVFKVGVVTDSPGRLRILASRIADGLDSTAGHFRTLRKGGWRLPAKVSAVTVLINVTFSCSIILGFLAVGYTPLIYEVFIFYSVLVLIFLVAMVFLGGIAAMELTALAYWSQLTGLSASEILVAMLAVKVWQIFEMASAAMFLFRYISRLERGEVLAMFAKNPRESPGSSEGDHEATGGRSERRGRDHGRGGSSLSLGGEQQLADRG